VKEGRLHSAKGGGGGGGRKISTKGMIRGVLARELLHWYLHTKIGGGKGKRNQNKCKKKKRKDRMQFKRR